MNSREFQFTLEGKNKRVEMTEVGQLKLIGHLK